MRFLSIPATVVLGAVLAAQEPKKVQDLPTIPTVDLKRTTPFVDDTKRLSGATITVFQRMNEAGDLLRVGTTVKSAKGTRAIGTYIPATADGKPNAVAAAIKDGKQYRGVAAVVGTPYVSVYDPIKNSAGAVIGALYVGVPQAEALVNLTRTISELSLLPLCA